MSSGRGGRCIEEKGWVELEVLVVVPSPCYRNGNLEDHGEKYAIRTIPTRKEGFTRAGIVLYHLAIFGWDRPYTGRKPRAFFLEPARRWGSTGRAAE